MSKKIQKIVQLGVLTAVSLIMAFTPIGYIRIGVLSLTLMSIPVILGAVMHGVIGGTIMGLVFGLTSFAQAFTGDPLGAAAISISIPRLFVMCVLPRLLMGFLAGLLFSFLNKGQHTKGWAYEITGFAASIMNTVFFLSSLVILFGGEPAIKTILGAGAGDGKAIILKVLLASTIAQAVAEAIVCTIIAGVVAKTVHLAFAKARSGS